MYFLKFGDLDSAKFPFFVRVSLVGPFLYLSRKGPKIIFTYFIFRAGYVSFYFVHNYLSLPRALTLYTQLLGQWKGDKLLKSEVYYKPKWSITFIVIGLQNFLSGKIEKSWNMLNFSIQCNLVNKGQPRLHKFSIFIKVTSLNSNFYFYTSHLKTSPLLI